MRMSSLHCAEEAGTVARKGGGMEEEFFLFVLSWQQLEQVKMLLLRELKAFLGVEGLKMQVEGDNWGGREVRIWALIEGLGFAKRSVTFSKAIGGKISKDLV